MKTLREYICDVVELYYINNIHKPGNQTGVRFTREFRRKIAAELALENFIDRMQILLLKRYLRYRRAAK